jgi:hypothetical protein
LPPCRRIIVEWFFILDASSELERSIGSTLVHLMWLELCGQVQLAGGTADPHSLEAILQNPEEMIERHLHLTTVKCQTAELFMKMRIVNETLERLPAAARPMLGAPVEMFPASNDVAQNVALETRPLLS